MGTALVNAVATVLVAAIGAVGGYLALKKGQETTDQPAPEQGQPIEVTEPPLVLELRAQLAQEKKDHAQDHVAMRAAGIQILHD